MDLLLTLFGPLLLILMYGIPILICCITPILIIMLFPKGRAFLQKLHEEKTKNK